MKPEETERSKEGIYTIDLTPFERIVLINMLPQHSSLHIGILVQQLRNMLSLTDEEIATYEIEFYSDGTVKFGSEEMGTRAMNNESAKSFEIGKEKLNIMKRALKEADQQERLPTNTYVHNLYYKIVNYED